MDDLLYKVFANVKHTYVRSEGRVSFPNGSRILIGGYRTEADIDKYLGIEYDGAVVEELTQLSEDKIIRLRGSIRTTKPGWRDRIYASTNPGGIGHLWVKKNFVVPYRTGVNGMHKFLGGKTFFIPATHRDNPFLKENYISYLISIPGELGRAWRDGDWDVFEGMAFPMWDYDRHVIRPIQIPEYWAKWRGVDWGFGAPFVCLWLGRNPITGRIIVYRELHKDNLTTQEQAQIIGDMTAAEENISKTYVDPKSFWTRREMRGKVLTAAQEYADNGIIVHKADNARVPGKRRVNDALADLQDGLPGLQVVSTCRNLIETLSSIPRDDNNPEDVNTDSNLDHAYDALRYALTAYKKMMPKQTTPDPVKQRAIDAWRGL